MSVKFRTSNREIKEGYCHIMAIGYCDLQHLLSYENPVAYTCGTYGWNYDVYEIASNFAICTGYRSMPEQNVKYDYSLVREYDNKARDLPYSENRREELKKLLDEFISKITLIHYGEKGYKPLIR